jgi:hypothetical protein
MEHLSGYNCAGQRSAYRPTGESCPGELADMMTEALALTLEHNATQALIDITEMYGFASPGPAYRRWLIRRWADLVGDRVRVVVVAREEHICPQRTGLIVAAEQGMKANIFTDEAVALKWLDCG